MIEAAVGELAKRIPELLLISLGAGLVLRYAVGLVGKLLASQERTQEQLVEVVNRNTEAWGKVGEGMTHLVSLDAERVERLHDVQQDLNELRVLLARRPCVADEALRRGG
jgi:hypothetical protein